MNRPNLMLSLLLLGGCGASPSYWFVNNVAPFDGQTAWDAETPITVQVEAVVHADAVGLERSVALFGDGERLPIVHIAADYDKIELYPAEPFSAGVDYRLFFTGDHSDSPNFADVVILDASAFGHVQFQVDPAPSAACHIWYDPSASKRVTTPMRGRLPCIGFSEPLVPGWIDLPLGSFRADGYFEKTSGLIPEADPWLLCAVIANTDAVSTWALTLDEGQVTSEAGASLDGDADGAPGGDAMIQSEYLDRCPTEAPLR